MGLLERHGIDKTTKVRAKVVPNTQRETLQGEVRKAVEPGGEVFTDAHVSYQGLDPEYVHKVIDHAESYVKDKVIYTNGVENFWSLLAAAIDINCDLLETTYKKMLQLDGKITGSQLKIAKPNGWGSLVCLKSGTKIAVFSLAPSCAAFSLPSSTPLPAF